jgi:hypothetical protein
VQIRSNIPVVLESDALVVVTAAATASRPPLQGLVSGSTPKLQSVVEKMFDESAVIVWACGYSTNVVSVLDAHGVPIPLQWSRGQIDVDEHARVLHGSVLDPTTSLPMPLEGLLGAGLGYGLKALLENGSPDGSSGRADGVVSIIFYFMKYACVLIYG